jgi:hypothetical protein
MAWEQSYSLSTRRVFQDSVFSPGTFIIFWRRQELHPELLRRFGKLHFIYGRLSKHDRHLKIDKNTSGMSFSIFLKTCPSLHG